jgi:hypothetical protein
MKEFLIRRADDDFCLIHINRFDEVSRPESVKSVKIDGWGDYRLKIENCEVAFSFEMAGIQISFENCEITNENAQNIVDEICYKVETEIASPCNSVQISE